MIKCCPTLNVGVYGSKKFTKVSDKMLIVKISNYFRGCQNDRSMLEVSVCVEKKIERSNAAFRNFSIWKWFQFWYFHSESPPELFSYLPIQLAIRFASTVHNWCVLA